MIDVVMPQMGESIVEGTLTKWLKKPGEHVERDEPLFEISTDKVDTEIPSPAAGVLSQTLVDEGKTVAINTVVAKIEEGGNGAQAAAPAAQAPEPPVPGPGPATPEPPPPSPEPPVPAPQIPPRGPQPEPPLPGPEPEPMTAEAAGPLSPLVRRMARENNIDLAQVKGTGAGGRIS
ncbi:MAG TPA: biotin/lipoyl-containing protein, partial [Bryobacteraceae bacterium]|nr:biotin/lipoyl-containing protein [Bryobacteraceae bacterium]